MPLRKVAEQYHNHGGDYLGDGGIDAKAFYKEFNENIVEQQAHHHYRKITHQLHPAAQVRFNKNNRAHQKKTCWKSDDKRQHKCRDIRADGNERRMQNFFMQHVVIGYKIQQNIQHRVAASAGCVAKSLLIENLRKGRIEKVNNCGDGFAHQ